MIIELGHFALCLALILSLIQAAAPMVGAAKNLPGWMMLCRPAAISVSGLLTIAFVSLIHAYAMSDFTVLNVAENSHTMKPVMYKLTGAWGNHEGSMLLWVWMMSCWGFTLAHRGRNLPLPFQARTLSVLGLVSAGFLLFILLASNPFLRLGVPPIEGNDLNPVLQDPLLAIHPPVLYAGYVGFSVAFCFAIAALVEKKVDAEWAAFLRPWVLAAWMFLTLGIMLGATWAYYELGWGGYWFWDPVENASLMPWLAGTALLHSVAVLEKRGALKVWTIFLCIFVFSLSLLGTFLVRSGLLTSVHSFASDPARGIFILTLLGLTIGGGLLLYALRAPYIKMGGSFKPVSRETAILLNNVFLFTFAATVFMGTLYPLFLTALGLGDISVGAPYFTATMTPLLVPFAILMGIGPFLAWREAAVQPVVKKLTAPLALTAVLAASVAFMPLPGRPLTVLLFMVAGWVMFATLADLFRRTAGLSSWRALPASYFGMVISHTGFALLLMGVTASTSWNAEQILWMKQGQQITFAGRAVIFLGVQPGIGTNYTYERGLFSVKTKDDDVDFYFLEPEKRWYPSQDRELTETALHLTGFDMLYAALGDADPKDPARRVVRLYHHPLILWVLIGACMIAGGGALAASGRRENA